MTPAALYVLFVSRPYSSSEQGLLAYAQCGVELGDLYAVQVSEDDRLHARQTP